MKTNDLNICIFQAGTSNFSGSFIKSHELFLKGNIITVQGPYHEFVNEGRILRYFHSRYPILKKLCKLLPQFLYYRWIILWEETFEGRHDALAGFFKKNKIDVVLAEFGHNGANLTPHLKKMGIPLVVHFHGHDAHRTDFLEEYKDRYRAMFSYASSIISVSHYMTKALIALGAQQEKIVYNPYGPRAFFYENNSSFDDIILNVGRFTDIKAPSLTLQAFKLVLEQHPSAKLVMVGTGELLESCKALTKAWGIEDRVEFTGGIPHEALMPFYKSACCFVQHSVIPSYGDAEGTPNTILEAAAAGLPIVSTKHAGILDAVIDGQTGYLVNEYDVESMAEALIQFLKDKELARKMGEKARVHISSNYGLDRHIAVIEDSLSNAVLKS